MPVPFVSDAGNPDRAEGGGVPAVTATAADGRARTEVEKLTEEEFERADDRRFRREIAASVVFHLLVPGIFVLLLPALVSFFGSGRRIGHGQTSVEVALLTAVPGEDGVSDGQAARTGGAPSGATSAPGAPPSMPSAEVPSAMTLPPPTAPPQPAPAERAAPPLDVAPPPVQPPAPPAAVSPIALPPETHGDVAPATDDLNKAMAAARAALEKRAPELVDSNAATPATRGTTGRLLGALRSPGGRGGAGGNAGAEGDGGDGPSVGGDGIGVEAQPAGGDGAMRKAGPAMGAKGYGFGLEGDGDTAGEVGDLELERRAWRRIVAQKVNKYTLRRPTNRPLYPPGKPLYIHLSYFPDGTLREVTLRPPSSVSPGPEELAFLRHTATNIEQAQPLPRAQNPKLYEKGLDMRSFIIPGYMQRR